MIKIIQNTKLPKELVGGLREKDEVVENLES